MKIENKAFDFQGISIDGAAMLNRRELTDRIRLALSRARVVVLVGPRQVGKTTLARSFLSADDPNYLDLEIPEVEALLAQSMTALKARRGLVVIDEVQRAALRHCRRNRGRSPGRDGVTRNAVTMVRVTASIYSLSPRMCLVTRERKAVSSAPQGDSTGFQVFGCPLYSWWTP